MAIVTLNLLYNELKCLHRDVEILKSAVIPVKELGKKEMLELDKIAAEMRTGKKYSLKEVLG